MQKWQLAIARTNFLKLIIFNANFALYIDYLQRVAF